jgi:hypothetical protein
MGTRIELFMLQASEVCACRPDIVPGQSAAAGPI